MKVAIVKVSQRAGMLKSMYVYEMRSDGWFRAGIDRDPSWKGQWFAPKNLIQMIEADTPEVRNYDYNGIEPGTLVQFWGKEQGIVISRKGTKYTVLRNGNPKPILVDWENVVPVLIDDGTDATG